MYITGISNMLNTWYGQGRMGTGSYTTSCMGSWRVKEYSFLLDGAVLHWLWVLCTGGGEHNVTCMLTYLAIFKCCYQ